MRVRHIIATYHFKMFGVARKTCIDGRLKMMPKLRIVSVVMVAMGLVACTPETQLERAEGKIERAEKETADSMLRVYAMEGYPADFAEIARLLRREAERGDARAQARLAELYFHGLGVSMDARERAKWHGKAATGGNPLAQHFLAWIYLEGDGVAQDYRRALQWFQRAAKHGRERDGIQFTCLSPKDSGTPMNDAGGTSAPDNSRLRSTAGKWMASDYSAGITWWMRGCNARFDRWGVESFFSAANAGHLKAQYMIGVAYLAGRGVSLNRAWAAHWFLAVARKGHGAAKREYCALYRVEGTAVDAPPKAGWCRGVPMP